MASRRGGFFIPLLLPPSPRRVTPHLVSAVPPPSQAAIRPVTPHRYPPSPPACLVLVVKESIYLVQRDQGLAGPDDTVASPGSVWFAREGGREGRGRDDDWIRLSRILALSSFRDAPITPKQTGKRRRTEEERRKQRRGCRTEDAKGMKWASRRSKIYDEEKEAEQTQ